MERIEERSARLPSKRPHQHRRDAERGDEQPDRRRVATVGEDEQGQDRLDDELMGETQTAADARDQQRARVQAIERVRFLGGAGCRRCHGWRVDQAPADSDTGRSTSSGQPSARDIALAVPTTSRARSVMVSGRSRDDGPAMLMAATTWLV